MLMISATAAIAADVRAGASTRLLVEIHGHSR
jgi:hypothetical protein